MLSYCCPPWHVLQCCCSMYVVAPRFATNGLQDYPMSQGISIEKDGSNRRNNT